jgi:hypothetical protein
VFASLEAILVGFNAAHNASLRTALKAKVRSDLTNVVTDVTVFAGTAWQPARRRASPTLRL